MKYYTNKVDKKRKKELEEKLIQLDRVILKRCEGGADILSIISSCKPYVNEYGSKEFATTGQVTKTIGKLLKFRLLRRV